MYRKENERVKSTIASTETDLIAPRSDQSEERPVREGERSDSCYRYNAADDLGNAGDTHGQEAAYLGQAATGPTGGNFEEGLRRARKVCCVYKISQV